MIIEKDGIKYWTTAKSFAELGAMSKAKLQDSLMPLDEYNLRKEISELENQIAYLEAQDDEVLVPNEEKMKIPDLELELENLKSKL